MKAVKILFICHLVALIFGLVGLLLALPHPEWWDGNIYGVALFNFGMHYAGALHIILGAATMLLFGWLCVGARRTLIFFAASTLISLSMELTGTSTGYPFGPYAYTDFLGLKVLGLVPYAIPLSWFYMGFTSILLAYLLVQRTNWSHRTLWSILLGAYFLTVWDLSLDPAMANDRLLVHFWIWYESGPYFGMPISNLLGWSLTGLLYMSISRWLWRGDLTVEKVPAWLPFGMYAANTGFAMILSLSTGLWVPTLIGLLLGLLPSTLVLRRTSRGGPEDPQRVAQPDVIKAISHQVVRKGGHALLQRAGILHIEGRENLPASGPTLIVSRHYHHLYDGCSLLSAVQRRLHILVAVDWLEKPWMRRCMEWACTLVSWPMILREERVKDGQSLYTSADVTGFLRRASATIVQLLRRGEVVAVFPEAYPLVDPHPTPGRDTDGFLPFRSGFARLVELAEKDQQTRVAIVPAGFSYSRNPRWQITLRFGPVLWRRDFASRAQLVETVERDVRRLSLPEWVALPQVQEVPGL